MAIQISEDKLSSKAKDALNNAKSKSQFLRDAIEYYVNNKNEETSLKQEMKEIKSLLMFYIDRNNVNLNENEKTNITYNDKVIDFKGDDIKINKNNNLESTKKFIEEEQSEAKEQVEIIDIPSCYDIY